MDVIEKWKKVVDQISRILPATALAGFSIIASQIAPDGTCTQPRQVGSKGSALNAVDYVLFSGRCYGIFH